MTCKEAKSKIVIDYEDDGEATAKGIEKLINKIFYDFDNIFCELINKSTVMAEKLLELENMTCDRCKYYKNEICDNFHNAYPGYEFNEYLRPPDKDFGCNQWGAKDE